jgi:hypothetical protein
MQSNTRRFIATIAIGSGLMLPLHTAVAQTPDPKSLAAQWVQWAFSIPTSVNPQLDTTGRDCMVGQRGSIWFLAGVFGGGTATRTCAVPAGTVLFFPVANSSAFDNPGVCGQGGKIPVAKWREDNAAFVEGVTAKSVKVDGQQVATPRIQSDVFAVAFPEVNVFDPFCSPNPPGFPAGIYSPAVTDGFYTTIGPLGVGQHTVQIKAKNPSQNFNLNVTYNLTVVPLTLQ